MPDTRPMISVVVPTYKRPDLLERCLEALLTQTLPATQYEIIVCDDGPSQAAREVVDRARAGSAGQPLLRYCPVTGTQGPAGARNVGWKAALAPVIAFTDDDTVPTENWLAEGLAAIQAGADAASGRIVMPLPERPTDYEKDAARLEEAEFATANVFVRRDALHAVGGFDERFTIAWREDSDLQFSLLEKGFSIVRALKAVVVHPLRPAGFASGARMQKKIMYDVLLLRKFPQLYRARIRPGWPWLYLSITASLIVAVFGFLAGWNRVALAAALTWAVLSLLFFFRRLSASSLSLANVADLFITSLVIPPLSIFWRLVGMVRFGRAFP